MNNEQAPRFESIEVGAWTVGGARKKALKLGRQLAGKDEFFWVQNQFDGYPEPVDVSQEPSVLVDAFGDGRIHHFLGGRFRGAIARKPEAHRPGFESWAYQGWPWDKKYDRVVVLKSEPQTEQNFSEF